jgi:hypothetical protein
MKRRTRSSARPRHVQRQRTKPEPAGWERPEVRTYSMCPRCWADLSHIPHCDFCPSCRPTLMLREQS